MGAVGETEAHRFRAMGTDVTVLGPRGASTDTAARSVERRFLREERRCSRFRSDSELMHLNRNAGRWTEVSAGLHEVVRHALDAARRTGGLIDPTVLGAVIAAGYDRDFDEVLAGARDAIRPPVPCGRWRAIGLRPSAIRLPPGVGLDLGGIAKGWTVDRALADGMATGVGWLLVNAGGDLRVVGDAPSLEIGVEDPEARDRELVRLRLRAGALATSSITRRAWGALSHHLIDPRTGSPAVTDLVQATAWAPTCAEAEVRAKDLLLRGTAPGVAAPSVVVTRDGSAFVAIPEERRVAA
jgi:FAD:protein FMN transferase